MKFIQHDYTPTKFELSIKQHGSVTFTGLIVPQPRLPVEVSFGGTEVFYWRWRGYGVSPEDPFLVMFDSGLPVGKVGTRLNICSKSPDGHKILAHEWVRSFKHGKTFWEGTTFGAVEYMKILEAARRVFYGDLGIPPTKFKDEEIRFLQEEKRRQVEEEKKKQELDCLIRQRQETAEWDF